MKRCESFLCWFLAFSLSWNNLTNGWTWIAYASISDFTSEFYHITLSQVNWISLLYAVIMTAGSVPIIWFIDHFGIKLTLIISAVLNLLCAIMHVLSSSEIVAVNFRYAILIVGSVLGAVAQPLCLFSSTKLAATWFTPEKRVTANTLASMGNPLGILISNLLSPIIATDQTKLPTLNLINLIPPCIGLILVVISVGLAPKRCNTLLVDEKVSFINQVKACVKNLQFCLLAMCFGIGLATFTAISTLIQQILCPLGYTDLFSGLCGALFLGLGFPGVFIVGYIVNKTHALKEVVKWSILLTSVGMIGLSITSTLPNQHFLVAFSVSWMGLFGFGAYPSSLELAAEVAHPAGEVISTGVLISISQILGLIIIPVAQEIAVPVPHLSKISACSVDDIRSYWISNTGLAVIGVINASVFLLRFNSKYKRRMMANNLSNLGEIKVPLIKEVE